MRLILSILGVVSSAAAQGMWVQAAPPTVPAGRQGCALTLDTATLRVVMYGGTTAAGTVGDLWQWTGGDWLLLSSGSPGPVRRNAAAIASEGPLGLLVFGGYFPGFGGIISPPQVRNDTWRFASGTWTQLSPALSPPARQDHAMVTTPQGVLMFGGCGLNGVPLFQDTWSWNGTTWTQLAPVTSPPARFGHQMAYDTARGVTVLFGGRDANLIGTQFANTWEWNGSWSLRTPLHQPPGGMPAGMAFSPATQRTIVSASTGVPAAPNTTWAWDGTDWQQLATAGASFARSGSRLAFVPGVGGGVFFGGLDGASLSSSTFQYFESAASVASFGAGCLGPNNLVPSLGAAPGTLPRLGTTMQLRVANLPNGFTVPMLALGLSNTVSAGPPPYALPFDLGVVGWPGCAQLVSLESLTATASFAAVLDVPFAVPLVGELLGYAFHGQAIVFYPGGQVAVSNGLSAVVGI